MRRIPAMPCDRRVAIREAHRPFAFDWREHSDLPVYAHARRSPPCYRVGRRNDIVVTLALKVPCPPVEVRQVERDAFARAAASPFGSRSSLIAARRRIPAAHFPVKEHSSDSSPVSKISRKDKTLPSLRDRPRKLLNSGILSVKHSPTHAEASRRSCEESGLLPSTFGDGDFPSGELRQEDGKIASAPARQNSGDIFPDHPAGMCAKSQSRKLKREIASFIFKSFPQSGLAERLAGSSAHQKIDIAPVVPWTDLREVAEVRPRFGTAGRRSFRTADANASISDTNAHSHPRCRHATVAASIPLHTLPYRMAALLSSSAFS